MKTEKEVKNLLLRLEKILNRIQAIPNKERPISLKYDSDEYQALVTQKYFYELILDYPGTDANEGYTHLEDFLDEIESK